MRKLCVALAMLASSPAIAEWQYSETKDAMTDAKYARAFAKGDNGAIGLKCDSPGTDSLYVHFISTEYLGGRGGRAGSRSLMYRFDEKTPMTNSASYDGRSAIITERQAVWTFVHQLESASRLVVRASDYNGREYTTVVDVTGAERELAKVIAACTAIEH